MDKKIKWTCQMGMGIALFVVLSRLISFPVFENYYLCLGYFVMAMYLYSFGTLSGILVGCLGTVLYCLLINGLRGMPGWTVGNLVIGLLLGLVFRLVHNRKYNKILKDILVYITIFVSVLIGILLVKSFIEMLLYGEPFFIRCGSNIYAFVADLIVLFISYPLCKYMHKLIRKNSF